MTILCSAQEAEVIIVALDHLSDHLIRDEAITRPLVGMAEITIDIASDVAQRIEGQLRPNSPRIQAERELDEKLTGGFITIINRHP